MSRTTGEYPKEEWIEAQRLGLSAAAQIHREGLQRQELAAEVADRLMKSYMHLVPDPDARLRIAFTIAKNADRAERRTGFARRAAQESLARQKSSGTPAQTVQSDPVADALRAIVSNLTAEERLLLTLRAEAGLAFAEIAAVCGKPLSTVHFQFSRLTGVLKTMLVEMADRDPSLRDALSERGLLRA